MHHPSALTSKVTSTVSSVCINTTTGSSESGFVGSRRWSGTSSAEQSTAALSLPRSRPRWDKPVAAHRAIAPRVRHLPSDRQFFLRPCRGFARFPR